MAYLVQSLVVVERFWSSLRRDNRSLASVRTATECHLDGLVQFLDQLGSSDRDILHRASNRPIDPNGVMRRLGMHGDLILERVGCLARQIRGAIPRWSLQWTTKATDDATKLTIAAPILPSNLDPTNQPINQSTNNNDGRPVLNE